MAGLVVIDQLATSAEAVAVLSFAGGIGAWVSRQLAKRRSQKEAGDRAQEEDERRREEWEHDVDSALFGAKAEPDRGIPSRTGIIEQLSQNTEATRMLVNEVSSLNREMKQHIREGHPNGGRSAG